MRTSNLKRCMSFLLALLMMFSTVPVQAFAAEGEVHVHEEDVAIVEEHVHAEEEEADSVVESSSESEEDEPEPEPSESEEAEEPEPSESEEAEDPKPSESEEAEEPEPSESEEAEDPEPTETETAETEPEPSESETVTVEPEYSEAYYAVLEAMDDILLKYLGTTDPLTKDEMGEIVMNNGEEMAQEAIDEVNALGETEEVHALSEDKQAALIEEQAHFFDFLEVLNTVFPEPMPIATTVNVLGGQIQVTDSAGTGTVSGDVVTATVKGEKGGWMGTGKTSTSTITITNTSGSAAAIAFNWSVSGHSSFTDPYGGSITSGTYSASLGSGATVTITMSATGTDGSFVSPGSDKTATLTLSGFSLTSVVGYANVTVNYNNTLGSVKGYVDGTETVMSSDTQYTVGSDKGITAYPNSNVTFLGWINAEDNSLVTDDTIYYPDKDTTVSVKAAFATDTPYFMTAPMTSVTSVEPETEHRSSGVIGNNYGTAPIGDTKKTYYTVDKSAVKAFDNLTDAIADSTDSERKAIVLMNNGTLPAGTYTVPAGSTLLIPFNEDCTLFTNQPWATRVRQWGNFYRTLTMAEGAELIINGAMSLSAAHYAAHGGADGAGTPSGPLSRVHMASDSSIVVNGALYAWGYITGSGSVTANSGSQVHENFQFMDFRGGTETSSMKEPVFPMSQYYVQNIEVPLTLNTGATEYSYTSIFMRTGIGYQYAYGSSVAFIGQGVGMFDLTDGYVVKRYDGSKDRLIVDVYGDISISPISMSIATISINSSGYNLPINSNISVNIHSGTTTVKQHAALLPGSEINVDKGAAVSMADGKNLYVYDADQWGKYCCPNGGKTFAPVVYAPGKAYNRTDADLIDAKILIAGKAYGDMGAIYTTAGGAAISGVDGGVVAVKPGTATATSQFDGADDSTVSISITPAMLRNSDGSYVATAEYTEATTFVYKTDAHDKVGRWHTAQVKDSEGNLVGCGGIYTSVVTTPATCSAEGLMTYTCGCAHNPYSYTQPIPKADHTPGTPAEENRTESTCTEDGGFDTVTRCTVCNEVLNTAHTTIRATGHPEDQREVLPRVEATCSASGLTKGEKCKVCGEFIVVQVEIPKLAHTNGAPVKENDIASTCTKVGSYDTVVYCTVCKEEISRVHADYPLANHDYSVEVDDKAPTCTETGNVWHSLCSVCGIRDTENVEIPATGHSYDNGTVTSAPTCEEKGVKTFTCTKCAEGTEGHSYTVDVDALGHTNEEIPAVAATCTTAGSTAGVKCSVCDKVLTAPTTVEALGHSYDEGVVTTAPTCTDKGVKTFTCATCNHSYTEDVKALGHSYNDGVVTTDPTCEEKGVKTFTCTKCAEGTEGHSYTVEVDALGHTNEEIPAVAATCTTAGSTAGVKCSVCGEVLTAPTTVEALGHSYDEGVVTTAPTCTDKGVKTFTCTKCAEGTEGHSYTVEVDALGHTDEDIPAVAATCTTAGSTAGVKCSVCGEVLTAPTTVEALGHSYGEGVVTIAPTCTDKGVKTFTCTQCEDGTEGHTKTEEVESSGHSYSAVVTAPNCTLGGYTTHTCSKCGDQYTDNHTAAAGHTYNEGLVTTEPTCTVPGVKTFTCQNVTCDGGLDANEHGTIYYLSVAARGHTEVIDKKKDPTCTTTGLTEGKHCSVCNEVLVEQQEVGVLPHTPNDVWVNDGTNHWQNCVECDGKVLEGVCSGGSATCLVKATCTTCKLSHGELADCQEETIPAVAPSCTETGLTEGKKCSVCGKILVEQVNIDALGHTEVIDDAVAATCTAAGLTEGKHCSVCDEILVAQETVEALGHTEETVSGKAPTCTESGLTEGKKCSVCGETTVSQEDIPANGHTEAVDNAAAATCTNTGLTEGKHCSACGEVLVAQETTPIDPENHRWFYEQSTEPTCTKPGVSSSRLCARCTKEEGATPIPAAGHSYDAGVVKNQPTCTEPGLKIFTCQRADCDGGEDNEGHGKTYTVEVAANGHVEKTIPGKAANCTETGLTQGKVCAVCEMTLVAQEEIPATGHTEETVPGKNATCTTAGLKDGKKCTVCGVTTVAQEEIPALGHTEAIDAAVAATCTATGLTEGKHCSVCGEILVAQVTVDALGHTEVLDEAIAATCTTPGKTEGKHCSVCEEILVKQEVVKALGHDENQVIPAVPATCTATGLSEGKKCSRCGEVQVSQASTPALGHSETQIPAIAPTCTSDGFTAGVKCSVCDEILTAPIKVNTEGHSYNDGVVTTDPTCEEKGVKTFTCTKCAEGTEGHSYTVEVDALGHTNEEIPAVAATCTTAGSTAGVKCSVCGEVLTAPTTVEALGHSYDEGVVTTAPTCTDKGVKTFTCTKCAEGTEGHSYTEEVAALGHTEEEIPAVDVTCTTAGSTVGVKCSVCHEILTAPEEIPALGHTEVVDEKIAATCTTPGKTEGKHCSVCNEVLTAQEEIAALGHTEVVDEKIAATCTTPGKTEGKHCSVCNEVLTAQEEIPALGHTEAIDAAVAATCTTAGLTEGKHCSICNEVLAAQEEIAAQGHTEVVDAAVTATCAVEGKTEGKHCGVCDEVLIAQNVIEKLPHTEVTDEAVAATCTVPGLKEGKHCSACNEILVPQEEIPATGHSMITIAAVDPTCTSDGSTAARICSKCDYVQRPATVRPALGHTAAPAISENVKDPTCTVDGSYDIVVYCVTCDMEMSREQEITKAPGHTKGAVRNENITASDCENEGGYDAVTYCSVCNEAYQKEHVVVDALGHKEVEILAVAPTCSKEGATTGTRCSVCDKVIVAPKILEKLPHTLETIAASEPTCAKPGMTEGSKCAVCGEIVVAPVEIPVIDHNWGTGRITKDPTCEQVGVRTFTCSMCYDTKVEDEPVLPHEIAIMPAQKPTYTKNGWEEYEYCTRTFPGGEDTNIPCGYSTMVEIPALGEPEIDNFEDFIENLSILEEITDTYVKKIAPGKDPAGLIIKYIRTGVERYNSGSWNIMAGYEDKDFAKYVTDFEADYNLNLKDNEEMMKVSGLKNLENFELPSGDTADVGHIFGLMDISYTNISNANVSGWAGDIVDLLSAADQYGVTANTVEEMVTEIETKYFGKDGMQLLAEYGALPDEGSFSTTDARGDLDGYYIIEVLTNIEYENQTLTEIFSGYMVESLTDKQRADYFLRNKLGGVTLRADVREAVFNVYSADKGVVTLEGTREFKAAGDKLINMRRAVCYVFADYLCRHAGDYVDDMENEYLTIFDSKSSTLAPGVTQKIYNATTADNQTMVYYVATADVTRSDVSVYANYNNNDPSQGWQMQRVLEQSLAAQENYSDPNFAHYTENFNVVAAVNGGGYNMHNGEPSGLFVMEGYEWKPSDGNYFFGILKDGTAMVGTHQDYLNLKAQKKVKEAIGAFGTPLVYNGEIAISRSDNYYTSRASRTAVGVTATGKVVIMVVDGRQIGLSCGASMEEIAQIMLDAGCCAAINLDGGGSSTYVAKPEGEDALRVVSNPSDGAPRSVSTSIFFASTAPSSTAFDHTVITSKYNYLTVGSSVQLSDSAVSATGNVVDMPEGIVWGIREEGLGTIDQNGLFTAAANGEVTVVQTLDGKIVGSKKLFVVVPDNVYFDKETMNAVYGEPVELPVKAVYEGKAVVINENDVMITLANPAAGTVTGFTLVGIETSGVRNVEVIGTLTATADTDTPISGKMNVAMFRKDEASFDFDHVTGGDRQFAYEREVSNSTEAGVNIYRIDDPEKDMVTSYTFALDMSEIPIPEKLEDLTYMLPGADMEGASAWNFLLQLAERVSVLTNVTPVLTFDKNFDVDYSGITVSNEYFTLDEEDVVFDETTNTLHLRMNWVDQEQPIDANTATPLCIVTGIKLTPKADADWGSSEMLRPVNSGTISYDIYLRANALFSFASKPENQQKFNLYPFDNKEVTINGDSEKGGHFSEVYTTFEDSYTLMKGQKDGWIMEDGGWAYYENGQRYVGFRTVDGLYYDFGANGINIGQNPHTGPMTIDGKEYYAIQGNMFFGWQVVDIYNVSYYNEKTGIKEALTKDEVKSTCIIDGHCDYTSETGATKHIDYDDAGGHEYVNVNGANVCSVCQWVRVEMQEATVTLSQYVYNYNGALRTPSTTVVSSDGIKLVKPGQDKYFDYSTEYSNNRNVGTAFATLTAQKYGIYSDMNTWRGNAAGVVKVPYKILPDMPDNKTIRIIEQDGKALFYWGKALTPDVTYVLYKSVDSVTWEEFATTKETSYLLDPAEFVGCTFKLGTRKVVSEDLDGDDTYTNNTYNSRNQSPERFMAPMVTISVNAAGKPELRWTGVANATTYEVYRADAPDGEFERKFTTTGVSYKNTDAVAGRTYYYKVRALFGTTTETTDDDAQTLFSQVVSNSAAGATVAAWAELNADGHPVVTWTKADNVRAYALYRSESQDGTYNQLCTILDNSYVDTMVETDKTYYYKVEAIFHNGTKTVSEIVSCYIDVFVAWSVTAAHREDGYPRVLWTKVKGAESYEVYRSTAKYGVYQKMFTTKGTSYTNTSAQVGTTYYYKVKAILSDGTSQFSEIVENRFQVPGLTVTTGHRSDGYPRVLWTNIPGAASYIVYRSTTEAGGYRQMFATKGTTYTNTSAEVGVTYFYKVKVILKDGSTLVSDPVANSFLVTDMVVTPINREDGYPRLSWTRYPGAVSYETYRSTSADGEYQKMFTTKGTTYTNTSAEIGVTYYYKVRAILNDGTFVDSKPVANQFKVNEITFDVTVGSNDEGNPTLQWAPIAGANSYVVYRSTIENGTYQKVFTTNGTTYTHVSAKAGRTYYYKVKAIFGDGTERFSEVFTNTK